MELVLYHRPGCHLCEELEESVRDDPRGGEARAASLNITHRNVDDLPAWRDSYGDRIPVLTHADQVILEGNPDLETIRRALDRLDWGRP